MTTGPWDGDFAIGTRWRYSHGGGHFSWDVPMPIGTRLYAPGDGVVVDCQDGVHNQPVGVAAGSNAPSNWIILRYTAPSGPYKGKAVYSYWQHLTKGGVKVRAGQRVKKGDLIGLSGNSGNTTGPHLHLTVLKPGFNMSRSSRYTYLGNPGMVVWQPSAAFDAHEPFRYVVYVSKLRPGVEDSKSVRRLRMALLARGLLKPRSTAITARKPGNDYTPAVVEAVKLWQRRHGHKQTGTLTLTQAKEFFKNNTKTKVVA